MEGWAERKIFQTFNKNLNKHTTHKRQRDTDKGIEKGRAMYKRRHTQTHTCKYIQTDEHIHTQKTTKLSKRNSKMFGSPSNVNLKGDKQQVGGRFQQTDYADTFCLGQKLHTFTPGSKYMEG